MLAVMMAVALLQLLTAPVPAQYSRDGRTYFDNRSSATVSIYKAPFSGRSRPVRQLVSGDICAIDSNRGEQFVVTSPTWYRVIASVKGGEASRFRPLVIRNSHLNAIGPQRLSTTFANRSGIPVMVRLLVDGEELDWTSVGVGRTAPVSSFARMEWVARATPSGKFIQRGAIPPRSSTIVIDPPRFGGGGYWPDPDGPPEVELAIRNTTPHTLAIYKRTRFGGRRVETVRPGRVVRVRTEPGEVWRIEDTVTYEVLKTYVVPDDNPRCQITISELNPPQAPRRVRINFRNQTPEIVFIYRKKDGTWKYAKRIYPNREYPLEFDIGQGISIRDPRTGRELDRLNAPSRDQTVRIKPHGDHAHTEPRPGRRHHGESQHSDSRRDRESEPPPDARGPRILRRIFGD